MHEQPIKLAVQALKLFLHSLPLGSKFNVISFGTNFTKLFPSSQVYSEATLKKAVDVVSKFDADMGGTEILQPIMDAIGGKIDLDLPRHLYLLTDGEVSNTKEVAQFIKRNQGTCKVHTFGIGDGVSTELIKECAFAGQGHYSFIYNPEDIEKRVMEALQKDFLEYLIIEEAAFLNADNQIIKALSDDDMQLAHGQKFMYVDLLKG